MNKILLINISFFFSLLFFSCYEAPPDVKDGFCSIDLTIKYFDEKDSVKLSAPKAKVIVKSRYEIKIYFADDSGKLRLNSMPTSEYSFAAFFETNKYPNARFTGTIEPLMLLSPTNYKDTIICFKSDKTSICINEIYISGPINNIYYFYDQFIELHNSADETLYLDGYIIARLSSNREGKGPGADEGNDKDIDGVTFIFKFPGKPGEKKIPILSKQFVVIASNAIDHTKYVDKSVDLSRADFEFYNQYSTNDIDNPNVPNLINLRSDTQSDFYLNLLSDVLILTNGIDSVWTDGLDIYTIIDGVQYLNSLNSIKTLDNRIDRGFILSPPRYSGKSMQRISPGYDSDNASVDWEIISKPTPGFFK